MPRITVKKLAGAALGRFLFLFFPFVITAFFVFAQNSDDPSRKRVIDSCLDGIEKKSKGDAGQSYPVSRESVRRDKDGVSEYRINETIPKSDDTLLKKEARQEKTDFWSPRKFDYDTQLINPRFSKKETVKKALRNIAVSVSLEAMAAHGRQIFELVDSGGRRISRLEFPIRGRMYVFSAKAGFPTSRFSLSASYGFTRLYRPKCIDKDWIPQITPDFEWLRSESTCKAKMKFYDISVYYKLFEFNRQDLGQGIKKWLAIDKLSLDISGGYQSQSARYGMTDLHDTIEWWMPADVYYGGLDSFYKIKYQGPQFGAHFNGSIRDKIFADLSFVYGRLATNAHGWWNLRPYEFWQKGKNGHSWNINLGLGYRFNAQWALSFGYRYMSWYHKKMKQTGIQPAYSYDEEDIARNISCKLHGPALKINYEW